MSIIKLKVTKLRKSMTMYIIRCLPGWNNMLCYWGWNRGQENHLQPRYQGRHQEILLPRHLEYYKLIRGQWDHLQPRYQGWHQEILLPRHKEYYKLIGGQERIIFNLDIRVGIRRYFFRGTKNILKLLEYRRRRRPSPTSISEVIPAGDSWTIMKGTVDGIESDSLARDCKGKMKGGYRIKPENLRSWTILIRHLSYIPVSRNWHKTVIKIIPKRTYVRFCIKVVALNRSYSTNTQPIWKQLYPTGSWEYFRFAHIIIFYFAFCIFNRYN